MEVAPAAGGGSVVGWETVIGRIAFRGDWLKRHDPDPARCKVISVAKEPVLPAGCLILVDTMRRQRRAGRVFVVRTEDGLIVKRADKDESGACGGRCTAHEERGLLKVLSELMRLLLR